MLDSYLDVCLFMPVLMPMLSVERHYLYGAEYARLTAFETAVICTVFAFLFEEIIPLYHQGFTKDPVDYFFYALGAVLFLLSQPLVSSQNKAKESELKFKAPTHL